MLFSAHECSALLPRLAEGICVAVPARGGKAPFAANTRVNVKWAA
jgi:hypothetical protein